MSSVVHPPSGEVRRPEEPANRDGEFLRVRRMILLSVLAASVVFLIGATLDWLLVHEHQSRMVAISFSDTLTAAIAGVLVFRILQYERERRERLRQKLEIIAQMNHHIRNALQVISLSTVSAADKEHLQAIRESMNRIQWALREILPKL
jgi:signal transduction histidine kinase